MSSLERSESNRIKSTLEISTIEGRSKELTISDFFTTGIFDPQFALVLIPVLGPLAAASPLLSPMKNPKMLAAVSAPTGRTVSGLMCGALRRLWLAVISLADFERFGRGSDIITSLKEIDSIGSFVFIADLAPPTRAPEIIS